MKKHILSIVCVSTLTYNLFSMNLDLQKVALTADQQQALNQQLLDAAKLGKVELTRDLLKKGAYIAARDGLYCSSIHWTAIKGHSDCMELLLDEIEEYVPYKAARKHDDSYYTLQKVKQQRKAVVPLFVKRASTFDEQRAQINKILKCRYDDDGVYRYFIDGDAIWDKDLCGFFEPVLRGLEAQQDLDYLLVNYARSNEALRQVLKVAGAQNNGFVGEDAHEVQMALGRLLIFAIDTGDRCLATELIQHANDEWRDKALHRAVDQGDETIVERLLEKGVRLDSRSRRDGEYKRSNDKGERALHTAARNGHDAILRMLLKKGASTKVLDRNGRTALHVACVNGHFLCIRALLAAKGDKWTRDDSGATAFELLEGYSVSAEKSYGL